MDRTGFGTPDVLRKALVEGIDGVNVWLVYGTDGALDKMNAKVFADPKSIPPVYLPAPVIRGELLRKYPELETLFAATRLSRRTSHLTGADPLGSSICTPARSRFMRGHNEAPLG